MIAKGIQWEQIFKVMGWIYSLAWSLSFYGQICENSKRKNVQGMNLSFAAVNLNGFIFYALYNSYGYFISNQQTGQVQLADLFFALHAFAATLFTAFQAFFYPKGQNKVSNLIIFLIIIQWSIVACYYSLAHLQLISQLPQFGVVSLMGYFKLSCSLIKYIPQLLWNRQRRSTIGWSIFNVFMDLTGGIFSVSEIFLQIGFFVEYKLNITKLMLGILTIVYDLLFVYQHYALYPRSKQIAFEQMRIEDSPTEGKIQNSQVESQITI